MVKCPSTGSCLDVFLTIGLALCVFGITTTEVKCHSHHVNITRYQHSFLLHRPANVKAYQLAELVFVRILHSKLLVVPAFHCTLQKEITVQPTLRKWRVTLHTSTRVKLSTYIIWNSSSWEICLFSLIYLFDHLFTLVWTHS